MLLVCWLPVATSVSVSSNRLNLSVLFVIFTRHSKPFKSPLQLARFSKCQHSTSLHSNSSTQPVASPESVMV